MDKLFFLILAYFLGSIPFGLIIAKKVKGIDIRDHGSRNVGATNVFRVVGKKWGLLVFFLDSLKGYAAVSFPATLNDSFPWLLVFAAAAILGHTFSCWLHFRGGKGVATSLGVFLALAPAPALITFALWVVSFAVTRIISLSSLVAAFAFPIVVVATFHHRPELPWLLPVAILLLFFIVFTHRANIERLAKREERRLF